MGVHKKDKEGTSSVIASGLIFSSKSKNSNSVLKTILIFAGSPTLTNIVSWSKTTTVVFSFVKTKAPASACPSIFFVSMVPAPVMVFSFLGLFPSFCFRSVASASLLFFSFFWLARDPKKISAFLLWLKINSRLFNTRNSMLS